MSRLTELVNLVRSLPVNPLQPHGPAQLSSALQTILSRSFPTAGIEPLNPSSSGPPSQPLPTSSTIPRELGPSEEKAVDGMLRAIQGIKANEALMQVNPS